MVRVSGPATICTTPGMADCAHALDLSSDAFREADRTFQWILLNWFANNLQHRRLVSADQECGLHATFAERSRTDFVLAEGCHDVGGG